MESTTVSKRKRDVYLGPDHRVPASKCIACQSDLAGAFSFGLKANRMMPKPGDRSICAYCGTIMVFDERLALRARTASEAQQDASNETVALASNITAQILKTKRQ